MLQTFGQTTNFTVKYEDSFPNAVKRAPDLLAAVEGEFALLTHWFGISSGFGPSDRVTIQLDRPTNSGAINYGYASGGGSIIQLDSQDTNQNDANAAEIVKMLFVLEFAEVLMSYCNQHGTSSWNAGDSSGEGLSHFCGIERFPSGHNTYYPKFINRWLQPLTAGTSIPNNDPRWQVSRADWVSSSDPNDTRPISFGGALLFLYYLKSQLGFSVPNIIQAGGSTLEDTYHNLTGASGGFTALTTLLNTYLPLGNTPILTTDDPFPFLDSARRQVSLVPQLSPRGTPVIVRSGEAFESFIINCGAGTYHFDIYDVPQTLSCVASQVGFALPKYIWRINGVEVKATGQVQPLADVYVEDPLTTNGGTSTHVAVPIDCTVTNDVSTSTLVMTFPATVGHIDLFVEVDAFDTYFQPTVISMTSSGVTIETEKVVWEPAYYKHQKQCEEEFYNRLRQLAPPFDQFGEAAAIRLTLPDPPPPDYLRALRYLNEVVALVERADQGVPPEIAREILAVLKQRFASTPTLAARVLPTAH